MKTTLGLLSILLFSSLVSAQVILNAELRPRLEYRHGFKTLYGAADKPATFISQRTRLNALHQTEKLSFYVSLQNVRVWGDVPQLNLSDKNANTLQQAWAELKFSKGGGLRMGRQELVYDDSRILGNVNWAQQARSHDAAVFRFSDSTQKLHLGIAYNQEKENVVGNTYLLQKNYKALQFLWYHKESNKFAWSGLFLNNGLQFIATKPNEQDAIRYSHTAGLNVRYKGKKLFLLGEGYYQFGKDIANQTLNATLLRLEAKVVLHQNFQFLMGFENISGNDANKPKVGTNQAFNPFYGTNHKFNGLMDYFYVGNHLNTVGLSDLYWSLNIKSQSKANYRFDLHRFAADEAIAEVDNKKLGWEWDAIYSRPLAANTALAIGYSHFFPASPLENLKQNKTGETNNWFWLMITIKPTLFVHNPNSQTQ